jgi:hypothetical protein
MNFVTPKVGAKNELLFNKPASGKNVLLDFFFMEAALNLVLGFKGRDSLKHEFSQTTYNR